MVKLCNCFIGGGTNFESPLRKGAEVIQSSSFKKADIVFVTDGESHVSDDFLNFFQQRKQVIGFYVLSLLIGMNRNVEQFSDKVIQIKDFNDKGSFTALEI